MITAQRALTGVGLLLMSTQPATALADSDSKPKPWIPERSTPANENTADPPPIEPEVSFGLSRIRSYRVPVEPNFRWESSVAAAFFFPRRTQAVAGATRHGGAAGIELGFGIATGSEYDRPSEWVFGDSFGVAAKVAWYPERFDATKPYAGPIFTISLSPELTNIVDPFTNSRVRIPSLLGLVTPEVGWLHQREASSAFVRWRAPVAFLLTYSLGVDLRPSAGILYETPRGRADWFFGLGVGIFLRFDGPDNGD